MQEILCYILQGQKRSEESAAATALAAANAVTGGPPPRHLNFQRGMANPQSHRSNSSIGSADSMMSLGLDPPLGPNLRNLPPADRTPGSGIALLFLCGVRDEIYLTQSLCPEDARPLGMQLTVLS